MCRYAMSGPYKRQYVCFACRKAFKQPPIEVFLASRGRGYVFGELRPFWSMPKELERREAELGHRLADLTEEYRGVAHRCPQCGVPMIEMGLDFKAPPQRDVKAWRTLHGMYRVGDAIHTCGCNGPGWIPKSSAQYREYLEEPRRSYEDQLDETRNSDGLSSQQKKEAGEFWSARLLAIARELDSVA